jgi:hypothetical protein
MNDPREEAARAALLAAVSALEENSRGLKAVHDSLPVTAEERSLRDLDADPAPAIEMRAVIRNILADSLQPAIEDLRAAAEYRPERPAAGPLWDLTVHREEMERLLYDLVVQQDFSPRPLADPGDIWIPPYTPVLPRLQRLAVVRNRKGSWSFHTQG